MTVRYAAALVPAAVLLLAASDAPAEPRTVDIAFGNTVKAVYPDGRFQRYWLEPDGTWRAIGRRGKPSSGKWTAKGDRVCLKQKKPIASPIRYCTTFPADARLGRGWAAKDLAGKPIRLIVLKGGA